MEEVKGGVPPQGVEFEDVKGAGDRFRAFIFKRKGRRGLLLEGCSWGKGKGGGRPPLLYVRTRPHTIAGRSAIRCPGMDGPLSLDGWMEGFTEAGA